MGLEDAFQDVRGKYHRNVPCLIMHQYWASEIVWATPFSRNSNLKIETKYGLNRFSKYLNGLGRNPLNCSTLFQDMTAFVSTFIASMSPLTLFAPYAISRKKWICHIFIDALFFPVFQFESATGRPGMPCQRIWIYILWPHVLSLWIYWRRFN